MEAIAGSQALAAPAASIGGNPQRHSARALSSDVWGSSVCRVTPSHSLTTSASRRSLKVEMAISRTKKEATVEKAKKELEGCYLLASINYKKFTVKQIQTLRSKLPEGSSLVVMKNSLLEKAIEGTKWEALKSTMTGMNAFLFVHNEEIPPALKPFREMQKELKLEDNDYKGAVFEGKFYAPGDFKALETMPTRAEIYAKLLGVFKAPASNLVATLQAPSTQLVFTLKAYVKKLEEEQGQGESA